MFCPAGDSQVVYTGERAYVKGIEVVIKIYGEQVEAVPSFKYLGVTLEAEGGPTAHLAQRLTAFQKAAGMMMAGLAKVPSFPHAPLE